jgi:hypothetical protein
MFGIPFLRRPAGPSFAAMSHKTLSRTANEVRKPKIHTLTGRVVRSRALIWCRAPRILPLSPFPQENPKHYDSRGASYEGHGERDAGHESCRAIGQQPDTLKKKAEQKENQNGREHPRDNPVRVELARTTIPRAAGICPESFHPITRCGRFLGFRRSPPPPGLEYPEC